MPDPSESHWRRRYETGVTELRQYLHSLSDSPCELSSLVLKKVYPKRRVTLGWRLKVEFADRYRTIDLLIDRRFPYTPPLIALVDRPPPLTWPHIENDGVFCLLPSSTEIVSNAPIGVTQNLLSSAAQLIEASVNGCNQEDFRDEFLSYWDRTVRPQAIEFRSLVNPQPPSRPIQVWRGKTFYLLSDDKSVSLSWLQNFSGEKERDLYVTEPAVLLWLDRPLHPKEYPRTAGDVRRLAHERTKQGAVILEDLASKGPKEIAVLIGALTENGPCFAGVSIPAPRLTRQYRGFRPGRVPPTVTAGRYLGSTSISQSSVDRIDPAWIHGRDHDPHQTRLRETKVAVVGCGSIGGSVAVKLAQAGFGSIVLVDPETLTSANVGRHFLGAEYVGRSKVGSLATVIKSDYPHIASVEAHHSRWEDLAQQNSDILTPCDLIVSTIGSWNAEGALNEWQLSNNRQPTIVYGWTEPHACAGHAVAVASTGGCLQCGFTDFGKPSLQVTEWKEENTQVQEPACGAVYQPYGPIALTHVEGLISELVLDCILGTVSASCHRIWVARKSVLDTAGGTWSREWARMCPNRQAGGLSEERPWPSRPNCPSCQLVVPS